MESSLPLADKLRPQKLSEFVGQEHLIGKVKQLWRGLSPMPPKVILSMLQRSPLL